MQGHNKNQSTEYIKPLAFAFVVVVSLLMAVSYWSGDLVKRTLLGHAESSAITWRSEFSNAVPELESFLRTGNPTRAQQEFIDASMAGSDIFRFELFDQEGYLTFLSDKALFEVEEADVFNQTALDTARTGAIDVAVEDGRGTPHRPDTYVEAYMPIANADGATIGVVELYVDVTGLAAALRAKFDWLTLLLLGTTAVIYVVPTLLLILRNDQLRTRDRQLLSIAKKDHLTGLLNRGAFSEAASEVFEARTQESGGIGILFVDLDYLKHINDTLGHDVGDQLLKHVGELLTSAVRNEDLISRFGGDEFVILCSDVNLDELLKVGDRLMELAGRPYVSGTKEVWPSFSVGLHLSRPGEQMSQALIRADLAVYEAKSNGRGQAVLFSEELEQREQRHTSVANYIRAGIGQRLFYLEFQPIYDECVKVCGFEALLRLRTPSGEVIEPREFIPIAEDIGLIQDLGQWVLHNAVAAARDWPAGVFVSINVSADEFRSGKLPGYVRAAIEESGINAGRVCLELTETTLIDNNEAVTRQLDDLKALGLQIAIDDFGTGYSSLGHLWRYQFDRLKIDKSFLEGYEVDKSRYRRIIETIIVLGHHLDMTVVVEGVETQEQLQSMRNAGCDSFQGFLMSKPISQQQTKALAMNVAAE